MLLAVTPGSAPLIEGQKSQYLEDDHKDIPSTQSCKRPEKCAIATVDRNEVWELHLLSCAIVLLRPAGTWCSLGRVLYRVQMED
jgi:hypothetical protein